MGVARTGALYAPQRPAIPIAALQLPPRRAYFFGYPIDCAAVIRWSGRSFIRFARTSRSSQDLTPVASPSEEQ